MSGPVQQVNIHIPQTLGFFFAMIIVGVALSVDWRHYIRYWDHFRFLSESRWQVALRIFFLVWILYGVWGFIRELIVDRPSFEFLKSAFLFSLLVLATSAVFDCFFRWWMGPPKRSDDVRKAN